MDKSEANFILGKLNGRLDEIKDANSKEHKAIRGCLTQIKKSLPQIQRNKEEIIKIKMVGKVGAGIMTILGVAFSGIRAWVHYFKDGGHP